jgi:hypothetical protein
MAFFVDRVADALMIRLRPDDRSHRLPPAVGVADDRASLLGRS